MNKLISIFACLSFFACEGTMASMSDDAGVDAPSPESGQIDAGEPCDCAAIIPDGGAFVDSPSRDAAASGDTSPWNAFGAGCHGPAKDRLGGDCHWYSAKPEADGPECTGDKGTGNPGSCPSTADGAPLLGCCIQFASYEENADCYYGTDASAVIQGCAGYGFAWVSEAP